ncbi:MAG: prepilin-type N-terminal cleavage/methylation domain-containing protein [Gemmatimonadales bacterium]|nr:prepilin-type N-terminal cleavage/methylation domain-containing protein [Gemmatimonadales bacterium]NIN10726.1 prepilin-type N-terminal cleavage/methylation domain-containing protein [Gemmatimonadales bacterium]NIQ98956.1 prepilin-type N-terminal cleavage/methylation domain-containing protein [Gemmatimonadales bacterium]NIS63775.1 prepilin-type N-terminal cleavage/methylation domain-containing protein [Gemmatimonadales bacterium]
MRKGFTLIEMLIVVTLLSILLAVAIPFMRVSPTRKVALAAQQLTRDIELARTRALSTKKAVRLTFDESEKVYKGYVDHDGDGEFTESEAEMQALGTFRWRELPAGIGFGRGSVGAVPGDSGSGAVTFADSRVEFNGRGVTTPFGTRGVVYFVHRDQDDAVAAVSVTGSGSVKSWVFRGGEWQ